MFLFSIFFFLRIRLCVYFLKYCLFFYERIYKVLSEKMDQDSELNTVAADVPSLKEFVDLISNELPIIIRNFEKFVEKFKHFVVDNSELDLKERLQLVICFRGYVSAYHNNICCGIEDSLSKYLFKYRFKGKVDNSLLTKGQVYVKVIFDWKTSNQEALAWKKELATSEADPWMALAMCSLPYLRLRLAYLRSQNSVNEQNRRVLLDSLDNIEFDLTTATANARAVVMQQINILEKDYNIDFKTFPSWSSTKMGKQQSYFVNQTFWVEYCLISHCFIDGKEYDFLQISKSNFEAFLARIEQVNTAHKYPFQRPQGNTKSLLGKYSSSDNNPPRDPDEQIIARKSANNDNRDDDNSDTEANSTPLLKNKKTNKKRPRKIVDSEQETITAEDEEEEEELLHVAERIETNEENKQRRKALQANHNYLLTQSGVQQLSEMMVYSLELAETATISGMANCVREVLKARAELSQEYTIYSVMRAGCKCVFLLVLKYIWSNIHIILQ